MEKILKNCTRNTMFSYLEWLNIRNHSPTPENLQYFLTQEKHKGKLPDRQLLK